MEGFSIYPHCGWTLSEGTRVALLVALLLTIRSLIDAVRETRVNGGGYQRFETWVRRTVMVAFAGTAGAGIDLRMNAWVIGKFGEHSAGAGAAGSAEALFPLVVALVSVVIIALLCAMAARIASNRHLGTTRGTFLAHPRVFVFALGLLALLFVSACLFVSRSITGSVSAADLERGSRVAALTEIGSLVMLALLIAHSIWARARRRRMQPTGQVSNNVFAGTMIIFGAVSLLLALYTYVTIQELWGAAVSG